MGPFVGSSPQQLAALVVGWVLCFGELHHPQEAGGAGSAHLQSCPFCAGGGSLSVIYFVLLLEAIAGQQSAARQNGAACRWLGENGFDSLNAAKWVGNS